MRISEDKQSFLASYEELNFLARFLALTSNPLGVIDGKTASSEARIKEEWSTFSSPEQDLLRTMLTSLAMPRQTIHLTWTIGDFVYQRVTLARTEGQKEVVWLAQEPQGDLYQLQALATDEINLLLSDILKVKGLGDNNSNQNLSAAAVMGLLGISDVVRQGYYQSMLTHQPASDSLSAEGVQAILAAAKQVDFRWPSCFWEKNLPADIEVMAGKIPEAVQELSELGWIKSSSALQFELGDSALFFVEEMLNEQAKLAITVATTDGTEIYVHDSLLIVR